MRGKGRAALSALYMDALCLSGLWSSECVTQGLLLQNEGGCREHGRLLMEVWATARASRIVIEESRQQSAVCRTLSGLGLERGKRA